MEHNVEVKYWQDVQKFCMILLDNNVRQITITNKYNYPYDKSYIVHWED